MRAREGRDAGAAGRGRGGALCVVWQMPPDPHEILSYS